MSGGAWVGPNGHSHRGHNQTSFTTETTENHGISRSFSIPNGTRGARSAPWNSVILRGKPSVEYPHTGPARPVTKKTQPLPQPIKP